ncbi:sporulation protein [Salinigranum marinum]|uniref:sporulation protein n=1 Tax=Salinigranum marinum TaxID=1515595 RepID=UPI002989AF45|nr:sporulation protein [Salinigranum marinum]
MKKVLASIGIGNATVDTALQSTTVEPGQSVDAEIHIDGGSVEQTVERIELELETQYATDDGYKTVTIDRLHLSDGLSIEPGQSEVRTTAVEIPYATPVTLGRVDVWVETELDISMAVDPEDKDYLDVQPTPRMRALFDAMEGLGFSFRSAECEADPYGRYSPGPFVQEFEFRPSDGPFAGRVDEVELVCRPSADELTVFVEIDRRGGLLSELADTDERKTSVTITDADDAALRDRLEDAIERHA